VRGTALRAERGQEVVFAVRADCCGGARGRTKSLTSLIPDLACAYAGNYVKMLHVRFKAYSGFGTVHREHV